MRKFEFKKSYEEIEIAGEIFKISLRDEDRKKYTEQIKKFYDVVAKVNQVDDNQLALETALNLENEMKEVTLETLDATLGAGVGEKLYELADHQTEELLGIVWLIADVISERRQEKINQYTKKKR